MITEALWQAVMETEYMFSAKLAHATMTAALYGNSRSDFESGGDQVHDLYVKALDTLPYVHAKDSAARARRDETAELVAEWERLNAKPADVPGTGEA